MNAVPLILCNAQTCMFDVCSFLSLIARGRFTVPAESTPSLKITVIVLTSSRQSAAEFWHAGQTFVDSPWRYQSHIQTQGESTTLVYSNVNYLHLPSSLPSPSFCKTFIGVGAQCEQTSPLVGSQTIAPMGPTPNTLHSSNVFRWHTCRGK